jgi:integrase
MSAVVVTKGSKAYWLERVFRQQIGDWTGESYSVRMSCAGVQRTLSTGLANRDAAAGLAREWYVFLARQRSWAAFDAKYRNPGPRPPTTPRGANANTVTVGDYLAAVRAESELKHKTIADYEGCLRFIVSEVLAMGKDKRRRQKDRYQGGHKAWKAELDQAPLSSITPERIRAWKKDYVNRAGRDELARRRLVVNVNSYLRRARALFSKRKVLDKLRSIQLPAGLPFDGVELEPRVDSKFYGAGVEPVELLRAAVDELAGERGEELKAFLLGIALGLRRREMDLLEWQSFDFVAGTLRILPSRWYALKTNESAAELPVEPEILELFRGWRARASGQFVIESARPPAPPRALDHEYYRAEPTFKALVQWLRAKGVRGNKPIHQLRKLYGSALADLHGLHAASSGLRHADLRTTAGFYVDRRIRATPGFGQALSGAAVLQVPELVRTGVENQKL